MTITSGLTDDFRRTFFKGAHIIAVGPAKFMAALIKPSPSGTYGALTRNYSELVANGDEVPAGRGYVTGGVVVTPRDPVFVDHMALGDFVGSMFWSGSFRADGLIVYNPSKGGVVVCVYDFGRTVTAPFVFNGAIRLQ